MIKQLTLVLIIFVAISFSHQGNASIKKPQVNKNFYFEKLLLQNSAAYQNKRAWIEEITNQVIQLEKTDCPSNQQSIDSVSNNRIGSVLMVTFDDETLLNQQSLCFGNQ
jgi:fructose-1,6-bisphosphatase